MVTYGEPEKGHSYWESRKFKSVEEMNEGDIVAGVVYAAVAEHVIREQFSTHPDPGDQYPYQPTVIGYMVEVDDEQWGLRGGVRPLSLNAIRDGHE